MDKATAPTSAPGNSASAAARRRRHGASRGFTLIELLLVVALVAIAAGVVSLSVRDPSATRLDREAERLVALLEAARAEARAGALAVRWQPVPDSDEADFRFVGLPPSVRLPQRWLDAGVRAEVARGAATLGPEPMIEAQRIVLRLADRRIDLATDGLGPFVVVEPDAAP